MAASIIPTRDIEDFFENSLTEIIEQLSNGVRSPVIAFHKLQAFGITGIPYWQGYIQGMLNIRFTHQVDLYANTITLTPYDGVPEGGEMTLSARSPQPALSGGRCSASTSVTNMPAVVQVDNDSTENVEQAQAATKVKVARPPNSFILYRQEWHPKMVLQHPGLHNNEISKIIGNKWRDESEAIKNEYKRKAEDAKRQHAIDHPGYQYQPRKPSEKKKRMTKNKLAKLKAQANMEGPLDPTFNVAEYELRNEEQSTIQQDIMSGPVLMRNTTDPSNMAFRAFDDPNNLLLQQLNAWNAARFPPDAPIASPAAQYGMQMSGGQNISNARKKRCALPVDMSKENRYVKEFSGMDTRCVYNNAPAQVSYQHNSTAELFRQQDFAQEAFDELFNYDAYTGPVVEGEDAESALESFHASYDLDVGFN